MDLDIAKNNYYIQRVLKDYAQSANSLRGPSCYVRAGDKQSPNKRGEYEYGYQKAVKKDLNKMQQLPWQAPIFLSMDTDSETCDTELEGVKVACFKVGGEKRLCLPQVLQSVLSPFTVQHVQDVCTNLCINFSRCNTQQLQIFKMNKDLPTTANSCGLVTKSDAERIVNKLLHSHHAEYEEPLTPNSFKVYHECFGKAKGIFIPELYTSANADCVKCQDCLGLFSTEKFVGHVHKALENRTCHWGFDPKDWRYYLHLAKDQDHKESLQVYLEDLKSQFSRSYKRKEFPSSNRGPGGKKNKLEVPFTSSDGSSTSSSSTSSSFRPWNARTKLLSSILNDTSHQEPTTSAPAPSCKREAEDAGDLPDYLHQGPPKLLNPENVVLYDHAKQYDHHFAPNVSLAPMPPKKKQCREFQAAMAAAERAEEEQKTRRDSSSQPPLPALLSIYPDTSDTESVSAKSDLSGAQSPISSRRASSSHEFCGKWRSLEVDHFISALNMLPDCEERGKLTNAFLHAHKLVGDSMAGLDSAAQEMERELSSMSKREEQFLDQIAQLQATLESRTAIHREQQHQTTAAYRSQLQSREIQYKEMHTEMIRELHRLREELRKVGKAVPDIAYDFELMGDCPKILSPPESPRLNGMCAKSIVKTETMDQSDFLVKVKEENCSSI